MVMAVEGRDLTAYTDDVWAWVEHAECRTDPALKALAAEQGLTVTDLFYPSRDEGGIAEEVRAACARCPVRAECRAWAIEHEHHGYWGGASERARKRDRRRLGIRSRPTSPASTDNNPDLQEKPWQL